jgi:hypothetical protein
LVPETDADAVVKVVALLEHLATFAVVNGLENRASNALLRNEQYKTQLLKPHFSDTPSIVNADAGSSIYIKIQNPIEQPLYLAPLYPAPLDLRPLYQIKSIAVSREYYCILTLKTKTLSIRMTIPERFSDIGVNRMKDTSCYCWLRVPLHMLVVYA